MFEQFVSLVTRIAVALETIAAELANPKRHDFGTTSADPAVASAASACATTAAAATKGAATDEAAEEPKKPRRGKAAPEKTEQTEQPEKTETKARRGRRNAAPTKEDKLINDTPEQAELRKALIADLESLASIEESHKDVAELLQRHGCKNATQVPSDALETFADDLDVILDEFLPE